MEHLDWLVFNRNFTLRTITHGNSILFSSQQYSYSKQNLVLYVKYYRSKFADERRRLRTFTKRRSVQSLKERAMPYNLTCLVPFLGILALDRFCTDLAALSPYSHDRGPIFPSTGWPSRPVSKRLVLTKALTLKHNITNPNTVGNNIYKQEKRNHHTL